MDLDKFNIYWVESCTYSSDAGISRHAHSFFHFIYVDSGLADITVGTNKYTMSPGYVFLIPENTHHEFYNNYKEPLKTLEIKFDLSDADAKEAVKALPYCMNVENYHTKSLLLSIYRESSTKRALFDTIISYKFQLMLTYLLRCFQLSQNDELFDTDEKKYSAGISEAISYMQENLKGEITLEKLADIAGFEKNYFLRKFKKATNHTPMQYLQVLRIKKAKNLLTFSDMNVSEIAYVTGFKTIHYFSNIFLQHTGMRPTDYKKENGIT